MRTIVEYQFESIFSCFSCYCGETESWIGKLVGGPLQLPDFCNIMIFLVL